MSPTSRKILDHQKRSTGLSCSSISNILWSMSNWALSASLPRRAEGLHALVHVAEEELPPGGGHEGLADGEEDGDVLDRVGDAVLLGEDAQEVRAVHRP